MRAVVGAVLLALLAALIGSPVADVVARGAAGAAARPGAWLLLADTLMMAAASTILAVGLGAMVAWAVTRTDVAGRSAVAVLGTLPLLAPLGVTALAVKVVAGDVGGFGVLVAVQAVTFLPHGFVLARDALAGVDADLETAAISLGASPVSALGRITLALARGRLAASALAVFGLAVGDFATPFLLGGDYRVLSTEVYRRAVAGHDATPLATLLLLPALLASALAAPRGLAGPAAAEVAGRPARFTPPALRAVVFLVVHALVLTVAAAYVVVFAGAVAGGRPVLTFAAGGPAARTLARSLAVALVTAVGITGLALALAYATERRATVGAGLIRRLSLLPAALPGPVLGLGYLLLVGPGFWPLIAALGIGALPLAVLAAMTGVRAIDPAGEEAATTLGARRLVGFRRVVAPLLARPALAIFAHVASGALVNVGVAIFLVTPAMPMTSVTVLVSAAGGRLGEACALATILVAVTLGLLASATLVTRRSAAERTPKGTAQQG